MNSGRAECGGGLLFLVGSEARASRAGTRVGARAGRPRRLRGCSGSGTEEVPWCVGAWRPGRAGKGRKRRGDSGGLGRKIRGEKRSDDALLPRLRQKRSLVFWGRFSTSSGPIFSGFEYYFLRKASCVYAFLRLRLRFGEKGNLERVSKVNGWIGLCSLSRGICF